MRTILILASNPKETSVLRLDREVDDIREGLSTTTGTKLNR